LYLHTDAPHYPRESIAPPHAPPPPRGGASPPHGKTWGGQKELVNHVFLSTPRLFAPGPSPTGPRAPIIRPDTYVSAADTYIPARYSRLNMGIWPERRYFRGPGAIAAILGLIPLSRAPSIPTPAPPLPRNAKQETPHPGANPGW